MRKIISLFIFLFCLSSPCFAQPTELVQISQAKYFNIYSPQGADLLKLVQRLNIRSEYLLLESPSPSGQEKLQDALGEIIDAIFLETSDILHMYLYAFKGNIKICQDQKQLNAFSRKFFGQDLRAPSFYNRQTNSIYINIRNIRPEVLAYEMAHAIVSHYYAVLPPKQVQEILAKDVESQIRKLAR